MMDANEILRQNLKRQREARGLSHRQFAELVGKRHPFTFDVEAGKRPYGVSLTTVEEFARALEMQPYQLLLPERRLQENGQ